MLKVNYTNTESIYVALSAIEMMNHFCKTEGFNEMCSSDPILFDRSPTYHKKIFYREKNRIINNLICQTPELIDEWHLEPRSDEMFVLLSFNIGDRHFRFHQKRKDICMKRLPKNVKIGDVPYSHDTDKFECEYEYDLIDMYELYKLMRE